MDLGLHNKVAVVAGSSAGIGRAVAERFGAEGARVVMNGRRADELSQAARHVRECTGAQVHAVQGDVATGNVCQSFIEEAAETFGRIDALVTNSGGPPSKPFADLTDDDWYSAVNLLLMSAVRLTRHALPHLRATNGSIVNLTSVCVKQPVAGLVLSNSIRPGVVGLGKTLSDELAADNVRVNDVAPGFIWTNRQEYLTSVRAERDGVSVADVVDEQAGTVPLHRYGTPEEVANLIVFLSSPRASYITGTTILVDGGLYRGLM